MKEPSQKVPLTDINTPFGGIDVFSLKWTLASIPALIVLCLLGLSRSTSGLGCSCAAAERLPAALQFCSEPDVGTTS